MKTKFSIIIPTRNRAETLYWAIKSCLEQDYEFLEIIVSDNYSTDNTKEIVSSFSDSRIKYFNTGKSLSMSHNWEFALSKVSEGFVTILGDDDGFLTDALLRIDALLNKFQVKAISWAQSFYRWPSNSFAKVNTILAIKRGDTLVLRNGGAALNSFLKYKFLIEELPWLYAGFVHVELIEEVKKKGNGLFFNSRIPDIYSGIVLSSVVDNYLYSSRPYSIAGHSGKSNGSAQMNPSVDSSITNLFTQDISNIPFHREVEFVHVHAFLLWECFLKAKDVGVIGVNYSINRWQLFKIGLRECNRLGMLTSEKNNLFSIAEKNGFNIDIVNKVYLQSKGNFQSSFQKMLSRLRFWSSYIIIDGANDKVQNVFEASIAHNSISKFHKRLYLFNNVVIFIRNVLGNKKSISSKNSNS